MGSPRKKDGYNICKVIEENMTQKGHITFEYVQLKDLNIEECRGCCLCLQKGEDYCPIRDDIKMVRAKLNDSDGIIFNSPVYAQQITGSFKKVIDRLAYLFHRPELIGKPAITLVTTDGGGQGVTQKYLKMTAGGWGCNLVNQVTVISQMFFKEKELYNEKYKIKKEKELKNISDAFYRTVKMKKLPRPSYYDIYMFNGLKSKTYMSEVDYNYWENKGWLNSNYYYKTKISIGKKFFGYMIDSMIRLMWNKMQKNKTIKQ